MIMNLKCMDTITSYHVKVHMSNTDTIRKLKGFIFPAPSSFNLSLMPHLKHGRSYQRPSFVLSEIVIDQVEFKYILETRSIFFRALLGWLLRNYQCKNGYRMWAFSQQFYLSMDSKAVVFSKMASHWDMFGVHWLFAL